MHAMLKEFSIENYRGFFERQTLTLALPDGKEGSGLAILVGPNNSGKSTMLQSLRFFAMTNVQSGIVVGRSERHGDHPIVISLAIENEQFRFSNDGDAAHCYILDNNNSRVSHAIPYIRFLPSRRAWSARFSSQSVNPANAAGYWQQYYSDYRDITDNNLFRRLVEISSSDEKQGLAIFSAAYFHRSNVGGLN